MVGWNQNCSKLFKTRYFLFRNSPPIILIDLILIYLLLYFFHEREWVRCKIEEEWVWIRATSNRRHFDLWLENGNLALESHENKPWGRFLGTVQTASNGYPIFFLGYMTVWINFEKCRHSVNKFNYPFFSFFLLRENNITRNITRSSYRRIMFCEKRMEVIFKGKNGNYDFILFTWWRIKTDVMCGYGKFYVALQAIINLQRWINNGRVY